MQSCTFRNKNISESRENVMPYFGEHLHRWRKEAGLSLRSLADKADVSPTYIDNIEKNKPHSVTGALPRPSREVVTRLGQECGVPKNIALQSSGYLPLDTLFESIPEGEVVSFKISGGGVSEPTQPEPSPAGAEIILRMERMEAMLKELLEKDRKSA